MDFQINPFILVAVVVAIALVVLILKVIISRIADRDFETPVQTNPKTKSRTATALASAKNIIIVPGYGMAVAQAQHEAWQLAKVLQGKGVQVRFAIHPVAGRMPGHMNILLDEADVPHDIILDMESINDEFPSCDLALVIGANDIVNPAIREDTSSSNFGMPILEAGKAQNVFVIKRGQGDGFSGIENPLFSDSKAHLLPGDAKDVLQKLIDNLNS
jgi:NAD(P) transhydrogenase subunit beta